MSQHRSAFTLLEVAVSLAILTIGLTAATSVYITGLRWAAEARQNFTGMETAQQVLRHPDILRDARVGGALCGFDQDTDEAAGWLNGYFITRKRHSADDVNVTSGGGSLRSVSVEVYAGGTKEDGELVQVVETRLWVPE